MRKRTVALFALLGIATASAGDPAIDKIEAKLFLTNTATLSDNVAADDVALWNICCGGGESGSADDVLVIVTVKADPGASVEVPLKIEIHGADGKVVASRNSEGIQVGETGLWSQAVYVQDTTCNALTIKATLGAAIRTTAVSFRCGE